MRYCYNCYFVLGKDGDGWVDDDVDGFVVVEGFVADVGLDEEDGFVEPGLRVVVPGFVPGTDVGFVDGDGFVVFGFVLDVFIVLVVFADGLVGFVADDGFVFVFVTGFLSNGNG